MQKNWYIVYTKPKCEKKVVLLLTKRKIENFCPLNSKQIKHSRKTKLIYEPLFPSYVFVYIEENDILSLKQFENVVNVVYWKGKAAVVKNEELMAIREFINDHKNVKLERTKIGINSEIKTDAASYILDGKILMVKNRSFNVNLPSIGYNLIADLEVDNVRGVEISFGNKELLLQ